MVLVYVAEVPNRIFEERMDYVSMQRRNRVESIEMWVQKKMERIKWIDGSSSGSVLTD